MKPEKSAIQETPTLCRGFTIIFSLVVMGAALAGISVVAYSWVQTKDVWVAFGTLGTVIFAIVIAILSALFLTMFLALCGTLKRRRSHIILAVVLMTFWALFFLIVGISSLVVIPYYFDETSDAKCTSLSSFQ